MRRGICFGTLLIMGLMAVRAWGQAAQEETASAAVPRLVRFSGTLANASGKPLQGVAEVSFSLFKTESGGEPLWFETQTVEADAEGR